MNINPNTTALLAVHLQGDVVGPKGAFAEMFYDEIEARNTLTVAKKAIDNARSAGVQIVFTRIAWRPDYSDLNANSPLLQSVMQGGFLKDGTNLAEIIDDIPPQHNDIVHSHQRIGGLDPQLNDLLRDKGIDTLLFSGVATNVSVESTVRQASDEGYRVIVLEDACSAGSPEIHQASIASMGMFAEIASSSAVQESFTAKVA